MRTDTILKNEGMDILIHNLGKVDAERFISLLIKEPFDYTQWQNKLFQGLSVRELSQKATEAIME